MRNAKRMLAVGAVLGAMGALAAPAGAEPPPPYGWVECDTGGLHFNYIFSDQTAISSAVQTCVDGGGHPTALHFGVTF